MDFEELATKALEHGQKLGATYIDIRCQEGSSTSLRVRKGIVESSSLLIFAGAGIRALKDGSWGFASTEEFEDNIILEAVKNAVKLASSGSQGRSKKVELIAAQPAVDEVRAQVRQRPSEVSMEEKLNLTLGADQRMWGKSERIADANVRYMDHTGRKLFFSSEGARLAIDEVRTYLVLYASAQEAGIISPAMEAVGGTIGFEVFKQHDPMKLADTVATRAVDLLKADVPKGGVATSVLDNKLLALLVHEAFGHTAEADLVISGDALTDKIGQQVASEVVTIIDSPEPQGANGWIPYDDEGVKARPVKIVENGILKSYMHNRESAKLFRVEPTGNARAQDYTYPPIIRMRNTYMEQRDWNPEEIIKDTKEGYYLKGGLGGQADSNAEFMFSVQEAWEIKNGELTKPFRGVTVSGNAIDVLKSVDAVGKDLKINSPGTCGKFQAAPVDGGGPHIRAKIILGGRA